MRLQFIEVDLAVGFTLSSCSSGLGGGCARLCFQWTLGAICSTAIRVGPRYQEEETLQTRRRPVAQQSSGPCDSQCAAMRQRFETCVSEAVVSFVSSSLPDLLLACSSPAGGDTSARDRRCWVQETTGGMRRKKEKT